MPFQEISSPSLRKLFVQQLEGLILSGELRPGDRLPTERELADEMKISKTVVHEGLRELHQLGFLKVESRKGVTVADYAQTGSLETLMAIMDYHGGLPDKKTASSILDLRYYLEAPALRQLAAHHTPGDLAALRALQQKAEEASLSGVGPLAEALLRYHRGVTFLSGNTITPPHLQCLCPGQSGILVRLCPSGRHCPQPAHPFPLHQAHRSRGRRCRR